MKLQKLVRRSIAAWEPPVYPRGPGRLLRMDANTNLIGINPAIRSVLRDMRTLELNHYPSAFAEDLRVELGRFHGVSPECVITGNGSDELIDILTKTFLNPGDRLATVSPSFVMYRFYGVVNLGRCVTVPLRDGWQMDVDALARTRAKLTIIASPNNPTGNAFPEKDLHRLVRQARGIVVIDEAYGDFCGRDWTRRAARSENLIVLRTFSKSHGLAGLRVGYAVGPREVIARMHAVRAPFTVNALGERIAIESLRHPEFMRRTVRVIVRERARLRRELQSLGVTPYPSDANFILIDVKQDNGPVLRGLRRRGILARNMGDFPGLETCIRVTVGRPEHNQAFLRALREVLRCER